MARPTTSKPAAVQLYGFDTSDEPVGLACDDDGNLTLAADIDIDTTGLATGAKQDTGNTSLSSIDTKLSSQATAAKQDTLLAALQQPTKVTAVTKHDDTDITATASKGLWIGTGGDVAVKGVGDSAATTLLAVPSGTYIPGAYQRVMATNTTASNIASFS